MLSQEFISDLAAELFRRMPKVTGPEKLAYTIEEACGLLNLGETTLREIIKEREIAVVRRGNRVLLTKADMVDWLNRNRA